MNSAIDVAKYFVNLNNELTEIQIQKLVYYSYVWYIIKFNNDKNNIVNKLFDERPKAWKYGPVFISLYKEMKRCERCFVCRCCLADKDNECKFDDKTKEILSIVYNIYGKYSGNRLSNMTCSEAPWKNVRIEEEIKDIDIYNYYSKFEK